MLVICSYLRTRVHFLPGRGVRFVPQDVLQPIFQRVTFRLYQDRGTVAFVVRVYVGRMLPSGLRLRLLLARQRGRILRRPPIRRDSGLVRPYRFRANGLPCLRRQDRHDNGRSLVRVRVGGSVRGISCFAIFKRVANKRRGLPLLSSIRVRPRVSFLCGFGLVRFSWFSTRVCPFVWCEVREWSVLSESFGRPTVAFHCLVGLFSVGGRIGGILAL